MRRILQFCTPQILVVVVLMEDHLGAWKRVVPFCLQNVFKAIVCL